MNVLDISGLSRVWQKIVALVSTKADPSDYYTKAELETRLESLAYTQMSGTMWVSFDEDTGIMSVIASEETNVTDAEINETTGKLFITINTE